MVRLLFGIHCHQPVDNFYEVVDEAVERAYRPFLEVAWKFPEFKFSVHYSGWLLEYIGNYHKPVFNLLKKLSDRGQVEFFTAGYYEPVLSAIPSDDRRLQIEKLSRFIQHSFGQTPKGLWLTERVWDPSIIPDLVETGVEYVLVDDYHFISSGFDREKLHGYYLTENDGYRIKVFPIDKNLRYLIPFKPFERVEEYLASINQLNQHGAGVIFDDGEKFGVWPGTYDWVYSRGWLEEFIRRVLSSGFIRFELYRDYSQDIPPLGLAYLPVTSYQEMGEWSLPAEDFVRMERLKREFEETGKAQLFEKFVKGGIWKNFLVKYPEANRIHKRILELSTRGRTFKKDQHFLDSLLKAQCNDTLWHGIFGGLYLPNLRDNAYRYIIKAEKELEKHTKPPAVEVKDIYLDGSTQIKINSGNIIAVLSSRGAQLTEFCIKDREFNFQNTLTRYKEGYHYRFFEGSGQQETSDEGISTIHHLSPSVSGEIIDRLIFDWHTKNSFVDHITDSIDLDAFKRETFREMSDFFNRLFTIEGTEGVISLKSKGSINQVYDATLIKDFKPSPDGISCRIRLDTRYPETLIYLVEFNLHFATLEDFFRTPREFKSLRELVIGDRYTGKSIVITVDREMDCYTYPVDTVSQSERGVDLINQGLAVGFCAGFTGKIEINIQLTVREESR